MKPILLICGVSGAGKTWVCKQLVGKFNYIPRDEHFKDHEEALHVAAHNSDRALITECPFGERPLRENLECRGHIIIPFFVIESPAIVAQRYYMREGKPVQKSALTRAESIIERALEWDAPHGKSEEMLRLLEHFTLPT